MLPTASTAIDQVLHRVCLEPLQIELCPLCKRNTGTTSPRSRSDPHAYTCSHEQDMYNLVDDDHYLSISAHEPPRVLLVFSRTHSTAHLFVEQTNPATNPIRPQSRIRWRSRGRDGLCEDFPIENAIGALVSPTLSTRNAVHRFSSWRTEPVQRNQPTLSHDTDHRNHDSDPLVCERLHRSSPKRKMAKVLIGISLSPVFVWVNLHSQYLPNSPRYRTLRRAD